MQYLLYYSINQPSSAPILVEFLSSFFSFSPCSEPFGSTAENRLEAEKPISGHVVWSTYTLKSSATMWLCVYVSHLSPLKHSSHKPSVTPCFRVTSSLALEVKARGSRCRLVRVRLKQLASIFGPCS